MLTVAGVRREPDHLPQDPPSTNPDNRRPHLHAAGAGWRRVPGPAERHREGGRAGADPEAQPGVRDEIRDAGLQQAGERHGRATRDSRTDPHSPDRRTTTTISHQSRRPAGHLRRGMFIQAVYIKYVRK